MRPHAKEHDSRAISPLHSRSGNNTSTDDNNFQWPKILILPTEYRSKKVILIFRRLPKKSKNSQICEVAIFKRRTAGVANDAPHANMAISKQAKSCASPQIIEETVTIPSPNTNQEDSTMEPRNAPLFQDCSVGLSITGDVRPAQMIANPAPLYITMVHKGAGRVGDIAGAAAEQGERLHAHHVRREEEAAAARQQQERQQQGQQRQPQQEQAPAPQRQITGEIPTYTIDDDPTPVPPKTTMMPTKWTVTDAVGADPPPRADSTQSSTVQMVEKNFPGIFDVDGLAAFQHMGNTRFLRKMGDMQETPKVKRGRYKPRYEDAAE